MVKKFKRLLGVILALAMVIGLIPLNGMTTVKAATTWGGGNTIYLDLNNFTSAEVSLAKFKVIFKNNTTNAESSEAYMNSLGNHMYSASVPSGTWEYVYIGRFSPEGVWWNNFYNSKDGWQAVPSGTKNCYKPTAYSSGSNPWTTYGGSSTTTTAYFDVKADLVDYYNDNRVGKDDSATNRYNNQGMWTGSANNNAPYSKLNAWISNLSGYGTGSLSYNPDIENEDGTKTIYFNSWGRPVGETYYIYYWGGTGVTGDESDAMVSAGYSDNANNVYLYKADIPYNAEKCIIHTGSEINDTNKVTEDLTIVSNLYHNNTKKWGYYDAEKQVVTSEIIGKTPIPLYFGDLFHRVQLTGNASGTVNNWYRGANVSFKDTVTAVAQGIVGKNLVDGKLVTSYDDNVVVPLFEESSSYTDQSKYMKFYKNLDFPFTATTTNGSTTYSFDSQKNTVYYDYNDTDNDGNTNELIRNDSVEIYDWGTSDNGGHQVKNERGYFPFNNAEYDGKDQLNFGFGTKFTIPFTVGTKEGSVGKDAAGNDMIFKFTGDDDVWVYIDGALVLDMGGAHELASGSINFAEQKATVSYAADAQTDKDVYGGNSAFVSNGKETVSFDEITVKLADGTTSKLSEHIKKSGEVHTLTMYYMERGMWNSNMSISFNFVPLPSGLVLSKTLNTAAVNDGLKEAVEGLDSFEFQIQTKSLKDSNATFAPVSDLYYTLYDFNDNSYPGQEASSSTLSLSSRYFAGDFVNSSGSEKFYGGTSFIITETVPQNTALSYDENATSWAVYDSASATTSSKSGSDNLAEFDMGDANSDEFDSYTKYVNFTNTPLVEEVKVKKAWNGDVPNSLINTEFDFKVEVSLNGDENSYQTYALGYTSLDSTRNGTTGEDGTFKLKANETVTFTGIPVGAKVKVTETTTSGDSWSVDGSSSQEVTVAAGETQPVTITNKTTSTTVTKVVYAEAGSDPTAYTPSDVTIKKATLTSDQKDGATATSDLTDANKLNIFAPTANEKYVYKIEGTSGGQALDASSTLTVYSYAATNKAYVFDYGLKSDLATTNENNDGLFQDGIFYNENATGQYATEAALGTIADVIKEGKTAETANPQTKITADTSVKIKNDGSAEGSVWFEPAKFMDTDEDYTYTANIVQKDASFDPANPDPEIGTVVNGTIKVMPANVVYYEDNFAGEISTSDSATDSVIVNNTSIALTQSNDQSDLYGYDDSYKNQTTDSAGGATGMKVGAKASFTFKGTGFDLIARTGGKTGTIVYKVKKLDDNKLEYYGAVDTYYNNGTLYQLPVLSVKDMDYGTHEVTILVVEDENNTEENPTIFYLDGVRIYDPADDTLDDEYAKKNADEVNADIKDIRQMILGKAEITENGIVDSLGEQITSAAVPDSSASVLYYSEDTEDTFNNTLYFYGFMNQEDMASGTPTYSTSLAEYLRRGPANEVYLSADAGVAFVVKADGTSNPTFQVEAKLVDLSTGGSSETPTLSMLSGENKVRKSISEIATKTAMYYDVNVTDGIPLGSDYYLVVLTGDSNRSSCISLTNLKTKGYTISSPTDDAVTNLVSGKIEEYVPCFETEDAYTVDVEFVSYETTVARGKNVKAIVAVPAGSPVSGFQVYGNDNALTTTTEKLEKQTADGKDQYRVSFMMTNAKGTFTLKFVPYKIVKENDVEKKVESATFLQKSVTIRR